MKQHEIFVMPDGSVRFIYDDALKGVLEVGKSDVRRVSHVDPISSEDGLEWWADLYPVDGPRLGPFESRDEAIQAELTWLSEYLSKIQ